MKARLERKARMAYSVKCAALRVKKCIAASRDSLRSGNSQSKNGPIKRDVFTDENSAVEAIEINTIHNINGP